MTIRNKWLSFVLPLVLGWHIANGQQIGVAMFQQELLKASIVIELKQGNDYRPIGSGVLVIASNSWVYIVSANHVIPADGDVYFRFPDTDVKKPFHHHSHLWDTNKTGLGWVRSPSDDLAITQITFTQEYDLKASSLTSQLALYDDVSIGDDVYVVGCPSSVMQMPVPLLNINLPIMNAVRRGIISAKMDDDRFLIDAFVFPGNSGGPVFWKPATGVNFKGGITGPEIQGRPSSLIGIILAYAPYSEIAISQQSGRPRSFSEENSGLAVAVSASRILRLYSQVETNRSISVLKPVLSSPALLPSGTRLN